MKRSVPFTSGSVARFLLCIGLGSLVFGSATSFADFQQDGAPESLKTIAVPGPEDLSPYVADEDALQRLGKALFWDMQVGSDGIQACASCHYHAGTVNRITNEMTPGANGLFNPTASGGEGPNYTYNAGDFPFHQKEDPLDNDSETVFDTDDTFGPQGVFSFDFIGVSDTDVDFGNPTIDQDGFRQCDLNLRRSEPRQAPSVINAVYADRLFSDGRANRFFNGEDIFGDQNDGASILMTDGLGGVAAPVQILLDQSALASQALGPVLNDREMSYASRTWPDIGKKMLKLNPLHKQVVANDDSVLGAISNYPANGITPLEGPKYRDMVEAAFVASLWEDGVTDFGGFPQIEQNFAFFFGLAVQAYERTLVSDDSPYDQWAEAGMPEDGGGILTAEEMAGLDFFINRGDCVSCHGGPEFAGATVSQFLGSDEDPPQESRIEFMLMADGKADDKCCLETNPPPVHPGDEPPDDEEFHYDLTTDPRGKLIEIRPPEGYGAPIAWGTIPASGGSNSGCWDHDIEFNLYEGTNAPSNSNFLAEGSFKMDTYCNMKLCIEMEWTYPGLPGGDYTVWIGGMFVCHLNMSDVNEPAFYDSGFYNIGVRPTADDLGGGGEGPFGPFSLTLRKQQGDDIGDDSAPEIGPNDRTAVNGSFRVMSIRNIELTGPYMHNGGFSTLEQVMEFYIGGGHFIDLNQDDADPDVDGIGGATTEDIANTVAFMKTLTDERVRNQSAPFDHPEIRVPNGHPVHVGDPGCPVDDGTGKAEDDLKLINAVGAGGGPPLQPFHTQLAAAISFGFQPDDMVVFEGNANSEASFTVALAKPADQNVIVQLGVDQSEAVIEPAHLLFTPENWFERRTVRVRGVEDGELDGDVNFNVQIVNVLSQDVEWAELEQVGPQVLSVDSGKLYQLFEIEAEQAVLTEPMIVSTDASASHGHCVEVPQGTGSSETAGSGGQVEYTFTVDANATGPYYAWALTKSGAGESTAAFWVQLDDGPWTQWSIAPTQSWNWSSLPIATGPTADLGAGVHTLRIHNLEDGTGIDKIVISNDHDYRNSGDPVSHVRGVFFAK